MALQPCSECKTEISDKAASCPHCGAPVIIAGKPYERTRATKEGVWGMIGLLVFGVIIWKSCGSDSKPAQAAYVTPSVDAVTPTSTSSPETNLVTPAPATSIPEPTHNYTMKDHGEYGYEPALSDDDNKRGLAAKPLVMARYLGNSDGTRQVEIRDDGSHAIFSCEDPCEFIKVSMYMGGQMINTQRLRNTPGSIMNAVMEDAMADQLDVYKPVSKKAPIDVTQDQK